MSCITVQDPQLSRLADAIASRVGPQRFNVWFNNSTRLELRAEGLEISVPNDFISDWINKHFARPIQEAAAEVLGGDLPVRFHVMPSLFLAEGEDGDDTNVASARPALARREKRIGDEGGVATLEAPSRKKLGERSMSTPAPIERDVTAAMNPRHRLRNSLDTFIVGAGSQLAHTAAMYVSEFPGAQYNPLFIHGSCGLGKTHLLQGLTKRFIELHPTKRWAYMTGEEFTNEFLAALRASKLDAFRRKMRELDLLVIDDVHFLGGKKATQEEFLHTFNAIEAMGRQVVMASDSHPKMIAEFGESLVNRFVSGMVVRVDPPNLATRQEILRQISHRHDLGFSEDVIHWIARRVTQNVRELEGAATRIAAHVKLTARAADVALATMALGDLDRQLVAPVKPENILSGVCEYFGVEMRDLMSGRRQRTISLARSVAMYLVRKTAKLSFPEIGAKLGKRNHSTVISACRRIEKAVEKNEILAWESNIGDRREETVELIQRLEEHSRAMS